MTNLASWYAAGRFVPKDDVQAARWYLKAADGGDVNAMATVAALYWNGKGVPKNDAQAVVWGRKSAEAGNVISMRRLGIQYGTGQGVAKDEATAAHWYGRASELGDETASMLLADAYAAGIGVQKNVDVARSLYIRLSGSQDKDIAQQAKGGIQKLDAGESSIGGWLLAGLALAILLSDGNGSTSASTPKTSAQIANEALDDLSEFSHKQVETAGKKANCLARHKTWYEGAGCF